MDAEVRRRERGAWPIRIVRQAEHDNGADWFAIDPCGAVGDRMAHHARRVDDGREGRWLNEDNSDMLSAFAAEGVECLMIDAFAVAAQGPR